jgi:hypothetical protein
LIQAKKHDFADRTGAIEIAAVEKRALKIAAGKVRTDGKWIAGFYFNNALFRTAAVQHRILKIITKNNDVRIPELRKAAKVLFPQWTSDKLDMVHSQVNDLKHPKRASFCEERLSSTVLNGDQVRRARLVTAALAIVLSENGRKWQCIRNLNCGLG